LKQLIDKAPEGAKINFYNRLYGGRSMAESYCVALDYAKACHYDVAPYQPVFGIIAARIQATGNTKGYVTFCVAHADELRAEQKADNVWKDQREWAKGEPAEVIIQRNQAAYQADQLEQAVNARAEQIIKERELAARSKAFADARKELAR
jgi:hypothetical protein